MSKRMSDWLNDLMIHFLPLHILEHPDTIITKITLYCVHQETRPNLSLKSVSVKIRLSLYIFRRPVSGTGHVIHESTNQRSLLPWRHPASQAPAHEEATHERLHQSDSAQSLGFQCMQALDLPVAQEQLLKQFGRKKKLWTFIATWHVTTSLHSNTNTLKAYVLHSWQWLHSLFFFFFFSFFYFLYWALFFGAHIHFPFSTYSESILIIFSINGSNRMVKKTVLSLFFVAITTRKAAFWLVSGAISSIIPLFFLEFWIECLGSYFR